MMRYDHSMPTELTRTRAMRDGVVIAYRLVPAATGRSKRVVVLLHGLASNLTRWSEFVEHTTLKERWDILRIDLRGHGGSHTRRPIGLDLWCEDLRAVLDAEGYERAVLVGHSLGAQLAVQFTARHLHRIAGVALIDPVFQEVLQGWAVWLSRLAPLFRVAIALVRMLNALGLHRRRLPQLDLRQLDEEARVKLRSPDGAREFIRHYSSPLADLRYFPTASYLRELVELFAPLPPPEEIRAPVLVLLSRGPTFTDFDRSRILAERFPRGKTVTLDAYHWPLTERPLEVRRAIEEWCDRLE
jgi:esterase